MKAGKLFLSLLLYLLLGSSVYAQDIDLGSIVITGSRLIESPSSLENIVLDADELGGRGVAGLSSALGEVQGVDVYSSSAISGAGAVSIRGLDSTYTQVMYNGIKMFDPMSTTQYFHGYRYFPLSSFEKVEVLKGPYSSLYGSGGIGGNIHLTSKCGEGKSSALFRQEIGSYQTFRETLELQGQSGKLDYAFHASREDVGSMYSTSYKEGNSEVDPLGSMAQGGRLDYRISDTVTIGGMGDFVTSRYEYDGSAWVPPYNPIDDDSNVEKYYQGIGMVYVEYRFSEEFNQKFSLGGNRIYRKGQDSNSDVWYDGVSQEVKYDGVWDVASWDRVSFGMDYLEEKGESFWYTYNPKERTITRGAFLQNRLELSEETRVITGGRLEDHSSFGNYGTYSVRGEQDVFENGTIYTSYGTGFKSPSLYQLYAPTYGTSDLDPEETKSVEVGYDQRIDSMSFGQALFMTDIDNMIDFDSGSSRYRNEGQVKVRGVELYGQYDFRNKSFVRTEYTFTDTEKKSTGSRLFRRPENKLKFIGEIPWKRFTFHGDIAYIGNRIDSIEKLKAYYLSNFSVEYQVRDGFKTFARIENVLDQEYEIADGYETQDFSVYGGFEVTF